MRCYHCGQEIQDGAEFCGYCGASQGAGATVVLDQAFNPYGADVQTSKTDELTTLLNQTPYTPAPAPQAQPQYMPSGRPVIQLATDRALWKLIVFGMLTFGIYNLVVWCKAVTELNIAASRYDGKVTMSYFGMCYLAGITFGIYPLVWIHNFTQRMGDEARRRGSDTNLSASTFWLWGVLGGLIFVGPFIYQHKMMKALNHINASFNVVG